MNIAQLSIKRPIFITCIFLLLMVLGFMALRALPIDLFPDVTFPVVHISTSYPGASPEEIETMISKPIEDELSTISGLKSLRSSNKEGQSSVVTEFYLGTDIKDAEQQIRNHLAMVRKKLPSDIDEPVIVRVDPSAQPIMRIALSADLPAGELYDLAHEVIAPQLQQVPQVGLVEIWGGRKREIQVQLDLAKLKAHDLSATEVAQKLAASGKNIPLGKVDQAKQEQIFRFVAEYPNIESILNTVVSFTGNDVPVKIADLGSVVDTLEDEQNRSFVMEKPALLLMVYKQSNSNTVAVADGVMNKMEQLQTEFAPRYQHFSLQMVQDAAKRIRDNVEDVKHAILLGIVLTVIVVFFFLGNFRSTLITGLALPNSLLGAFILMSWAGFSLNTMSLLALSLAVGLLIDDAIVVRENIFRHIELGEDPKKAADFGTQEVLLAVLATTFTVLAVFGPIGFLQGVVGQFFKQFGLTVCFAMLISLFDALTMAPMLSAYFSAHSSNEQRFWFSRPIFFLLRKFQTFQDALEIFYENLLRKILRKPRRALGLSFLVFVLCASTLAFVPKTFLPPQDFGEFTVKLEMKPGTSLPAMQEVASQVDHLIHQNPEVEITLLTVGDKSGQSNAASMYVRLKPRKQRSVNTAEFKTRLRDQLQAFDFASPKLTEVDMVGVGMRPFNLNLMGPDLAVLDEYSKKVFAQLSNNPTLADAELSHKPGKPEMQLQLDEKSVEAFGLSSDVVGQEVRALIEGTVPAVYREAGREYDIRVRLQDTQRDLQSQFAEVLVPNVNRTLVPLHQVAQLTQHEGAVTINRENRGRYIRIAGDIAPHSKGMGGLVDDVNRLLQKDLPPPPGVSYSFVGQAQDFKELMSNMLIALGLGIVFIYFVLASLYESFITPFTIMLVLPLAACGAFLALFLTQHSLDIFSMIGCILLMGVASKNSILLVDYSLQLIAQGKSEAEALIIAGKTRLRPILMTSFALIAGMIPVAIGITEASQQRVSMGIAVIGGVVSSTLLTLIVIPAAFSYVERFNRLTKRMLKFFSPNVG